MSGFSANNRTRGVTWRSRCSMLALVSFQLQKDSIFKHADLAFASILLCKINIHESASSRPWEVRMKLVCWLTAPRWGAGSFKTLCSSSYKHTNMYAHTVCLMHTHVSSVRRRLTWAVRDFIVIKSTVIKFLQWDKVRNMFWEKGCMGIDSLRSHITLVHMCVSTSCFVSCVCVCEWVGAAYMQMCEFTCQGEKETDCQPQLHNTVIFSACHPTLLLLLLLSAITLFSST